MRENKWRASRYGIKCSLIQNLDGKTSPLTDFWYALKESLTPTCQKLGYEPLFEFLNLPVTRGPSYVSQRKHGPDLKNVVKHLISETKNNQLQWY